MEIKQEENLESKTISENSNNSKDEIDGPSESIPEEKEDQNDANATEFEYPDALYESISNGMYGSRVGDVQQNTKRYWNQEEDIKLT